MSWADWVATMAAAELSSVGRLSNFPVDSSRTAECDTDQLLAISATMMSPRAPRQPILTISFSLYEAHEDRVVVVRDRLDQLNVVKHTVSPEHSNEDQLIDRLLATWRVNLEELALDQLKGKHPVAGEGALNRP
jgi:hypothetical protein